MTFNTIFLPANACLTGDYYLSNNILMAQESLCANGQVPVFIYYKASGCIGNLRYRSGAHSPSVWIWDTLQPRYWSMIWRCGSKPDLFYEQGDKHHHVTIPPPAPLSISDWILTAKVHIRLCLSFWRACLSSSHSWWYLRVEVSGRVKQLDISSSLSKGWGLEELRWNEIVDNLASKEWRINRCRLKVTLDGGSLF